LGETASIATLKLEAPGSTAPRFLTLEVELDQNGQRVTANGWEFYAYPRVGVNSPRPGVYSEAGSISGITELKSDQSLPADLRLLITHELKKERHSELLRRGRAAVLLLGTGGFKEARAGYFLNQYGTGFGGIIEPHPVFAGIPHDGRLHLGLYQLVAGGGLLETEAMPAALRDGSVVWGLRLTGWISPVKNLRKVTQFCDVETADGLHLILCRLDLLTDKPESRYVLNRAMEYLLSGSVRSMTKQCAVSDLEVLLK
jgi:hypothetical protein